MIGFIGTHLIHNPFGILILVAILQADAPHYFLNAIAAAFLCAACGGISLYFGSLRSADDALGLLFDGQFKYQEITEIPYSDFASFVPEPLMRRLAYPRTFSSKFLRRGANLDPAANEYLLRLFVRRFPQAPFDHLLKAYSSGVGSSMVFLLDDPRRPMTAFAKFKLCHEMAHITADGNMVLAHRYRRVFLALVTACWALYLSSRNAPVFVGIALILVSAIASFMIFEIECESKADAMALTCLTNDERNRVLQLCEKDWLRAVATAGDKAGMQRAAAFAIRLGRLRKNVERLNRGASLHYGFGWNNEGWVSWLVMVAGAVIIGWYSRPMTTAEALVCFGAAFSIVVFPGSWLHNYNSKAEKVLEFAIHQYRTKTPEERATFALP